MQVLPSLRDLFGHMAWADAGLWRAALAASEAADDASFRERIQHVHTVQYAFFRIWHAEDPMALLGLRFEDLPALARWGREYHEKAATFLGTLDDAALVREVALPWAGRFAGEGRPIGPVTLGETLLQVAMHSVNHRGQLLVRLRELGAAPPTLDYIMWLWLGRPRPDWPPASA